MVSTPSAQTEWSRRRGMVIAAGVLSAVALMLASASPSIAATRAGLSLDGSTPSPTVSGEMPGMDHGAGHGSATSAPPAAATPTTSADEMPGMDHGAGHGPATPAPSATSGEMPGMDHGAGEESGTDPGHSSTAGEPAPDRPIVPVLGTFGGGTSAVLLAAGFLRHRDRLRNQAKAAARAARRSAK